MTAAELLDTLESRALLPAEVLATLRQQVSRSAKVVTPDSLAKLLVGKGLITAFQAEQLLATAKPAAPKPAPVKPAAVKPATLDLDDDMMLAPLDGEKPSKSTTAAAPAAKPVAAKPALPKPLAAKPAPAKPVPAKSVAGKPGLAQPSQVAKAAGGAAAVRPKPIPVAKPVGPAPLDDLLGDPLSDNSLLGDPLLGDPLGNPLLSEPAAAKASPLRPASRRKKSIPTWIWFVASGAVGVLGIVIAIVILTRSNGDAEWKLAEKDFQAGQDQDATQKLNAFLEAFPQHREASLARVYLGMARLRQAFAAKTDFDGQLTAARQVLPALAVEPEFPQVRDTLAKMLPDMAAGLAQQAQAFHGPLDQRHEKAEQAREGLALAEDWRFVPDKLKPWAALQTTSDQVAQLSREVNRALEVDKALTAVRAAIAAGNGADAFAVRDKLFETYPELRQGTEADSVVQELLHAAPRLVKVDPQSRAAETKPRATPILATFADVPWAGVHDSSALQKQIGLPVADPAARSIAVLANGAVYWLQANNGAPLGRQFVGLDSVAPVPIWRVQNALSDNEPSTARWVVFDAVHNELACYGNSGTDLRWRQSTVDAIDAAPLRLDRVIDAAPLRLDRRLYAATRGGRLEMIDADSGKWLSAAQFPEPLRAAPGVSADGETLYIAGDHGTLYFISAGDLSCTAAAYLGYGGGSVRLPPIALGAYVVVVENPDWDGSVLRVVSVPESDAAPRAVQRIALPGRVVSSPVVVGKQLMLATDKGVVMAFDASGSETIPLIKAMQTRPAARQTDADAGSRQAWFIAVVGKQLWLAGNGLARRDASELSGAMQMAPDQFVGGKFLQSPMIILPDRILVAYRHSDAPGVWVTSMNAANQTQWQAVLASPIVGEPMLDADGRSLRFVHPPASAVVACPIAPPNGNHVVASRFDASPLNSVDADTQQNPESADSPYRNCADAVSLPGGTLAAAFDDGPAGAAQSPRLFFSTAKEPTFRPSPWSDPVCSPPVALGKGLLIANPVGQICLIDVASGQSLAAAFQPRLVPGEHLTWRKPAVLLDKPGAIVTDGSTHLYRLGLSEKPSSHLVALAEATLARPVVSEVAVNEGFAFVAGDANILTALNVADLKPAKGFELGGPVVWGPRRAGDIVLIATVRELIAIDGRPEFLWRVPLLDAGVPVGQDYAVGVAASPGRQPPPDFGVPVGVPLESGNDLLLATADGIVARIDRKTGQTRAKIDLEQPLAAGPIVCGKNLAVVGQDGSIHIVKQP